MAKWHGKIAYRVESETSPGVWKPTMVIKEYKGDLTRNSRRLDMQYVNPDLNISNDISIIADAFANFNFHKMVWVEFRGVKWKITSVDASEPPRLKLTIGGLYNE